MVVQIKHPEKPTVESKIDDEKYMLAHVIDGMSGTYRMLKLIEEKTLPTGSTNFIFENLDGDVDESYVLDLRINFEVDTGTKLLMYPNTTITTDQRCNVLNWTNAFWPNKTTELVICYAMDNKKTYIRVYMELDAKTGIERIYLIRGWANMFSNAQYGTVIGGGIWYDTTTNITSLKFALTGTGTMIGTAKLYKQVEIEL